MNQILTDTIPALGMRRSIPLSFFILLLRSLNTMISCSMFTFLYRKDMGIDAITHSGAGEENTIAIVANGLDIRYPIVNKNLIESIENKGLVLSQFKDGFRATGWRTVVVRNELVVTLGDILIVTETDLSSGSMCSVEYA